MNLQHLKHFVVLAEELHFGRAAQRLHIAQPPLSQSIARFETAIGLKLFERTRRSVALTAAGAALLVEVRPALLQIDRGVRMARKAEGGGPERITLGFVSSSAQIVLPHVIRAIEENWPEAEIRLSELPTADQLQRLLDGTLDVGLFHAAEGLHADLRTSPVTTDTPVVALPAKWPQARKRSLHIRDLKDLPMLLFPQHVRPDMHALIEMSCQRFGFKPRVAHEVMTTSATLGLVAAEMGLGFTTGTTAHVGHPGVVFRPIAGMPSDFVQNLSLVWLARTPKPSFGDRLEEIATRLLHSWHPGQ
jgi:DNA-binding transcriptional LysR family regulator